MARKPVARDAVLDAFESLLIEVGERAATLDAVAGRAGVSKGGLLYHFPNKEALISALLERLDQLAGEDAAAMAAADEGAAAYFIRSSVWADTPLDRVFVAATRLAEVAHEETRQRFAGIQQRWLELLADDVGPEMAKAVRYMGDGLYFNAMWEGAPDPGPEESGRAPGHAGGQAPNRAADVESLLAAVERLRG
ncbi:TetR/AcrR family transcriptional regulator [Pseudarthrobacter sp. J64]|uniref:TetR/AcrR family transcriptional regulator n=1 Tax=Pseudarthrobacter sp. J64 TaxID=3116485 RepID=UPI002E80DFFD|nr:TetR/AcrR family transcriptional regulator [Pseudarthrobacter sp. J64]MEE2569870.1 TetR/AcrR family transcriptional regulator [Pseudarthrobacter sp. J64]